MITLYQSGIGRGTHLVWRSPTPLSDFVSVNKKIVTRITHLIFSLQQDCVKPYGVGKLVRLTHSMRLKVIVTPCTMHWVYREVVDGVPGLQGDIDLWREIIGEPF